IRATTPMFARSPVLSSRASRVAPTKAGSRVALTKAGSRVEAGSRNSNRSGPVDFTFGLANRATALAQSQESPVRKYTPKGADIDSVIDVRAIFQQGHRELAVEAMTSFLLLRKGR